MTSVILGFFRSGPQRKPVVANSFGAANAQEAAQLGGLHYSLHRRRFVSASPCGSGPVPELASLEASVQCSKTSGSFVSLNSVGTQFILMLENLTKRNISRYVPHEQT